MCLVNSRETCTVVVVTKGGGAAKVRLRMLGGAIKRATKETHLLSIILSGIVCDKVFQKICGITKYTIGVNIKGASTNYFFQNNEFYV